LPVDLRSGHFRQSGAKYFHGGVGSQFSTHDVTHRIGDQVLPWDGTRKRGTRWDGIRGKKVSGGTSGPGGSCKNRSRRDGSLTFNIRGDAKLDPPRGPDGGRAWARGPRSPKGRRGRDTGRDKLFYREKPGVSGPTRTLPRWDARGSGGGKALAGGSGHLVSPGT
jgi:hypothetical protein